MNTSVPSHSARTILLVVTALTLATVVSAQPAPEQQIPARKMLYPQREWSDWQNYPVRTVQDISPVPKAVPLDRFGGRVDRYFRITGFFYTQKIDGRWWFIDPDGHPYLNAAVAGVSPANSPASSAAFVHDHQRGDRLHAVTFWLSKNSRAASLSTATLVSRSACLACSCIFLQLRP